MDPLSITTGVIGLLGAVGTTILSVTSFIRRCREARADLTAVNRELLELQIVLELLRDDTAINENDVFPEALRAQVLSIINNCNTIIKQINTVLEKYDASKATPLKWVASGKTEVSGLKMSLEAHRGSLNLALEMINISVSKSIKDDTAVIRFDVAEIKQDTSQIAQIMEELATLRQIVAAIGNSPQAAGSNYILQQYLDSLTSYAETVAQDDLPESDQFSLSAGSQKSNIDISSDVHRKAPEAKYENDDTMESMPIDEEANSDEDRGIASPHERAEEAHTPSTHNPPTLPSNVAMIPHSEASEIQPVNNAEASNTQQPQANLVPDISKRVICVGDALAGKTSFLLRWYQYSFVETPYNVVLTTECYSRTSIIGGKSVKLTIQDTPGSEDYDRLRAIFYPNTDLVLICFQIDNPDSLDNIEEKWIKEVLHFCPKVPYILIGLRKDLRFDPETLEDLQKTGQRPVSPEEGEDMRRKIGALSYIECSAKTSEGIDEVFNAVARAVLPPRRKGRFYRLFK
ncbi:P-loop containing nucleoside triphosphate hydrolase protein [Nemania abortiva]|nr:P-loop containing nucleoside triphosphate hydrolase protein [Nemania abortiva]